MAETLSEHGVSTTKANDSFRAVEYNDSILKRRMVQWDYRDVFGELHSGVAKTREAASIAAAHFGHNREELTATQTAFDNFDDLLNAAGGYRPSLKVSQPDIRALADAYDMFQARRGDPRRASRFN